MLAFMAAIPIAVLDGLIGLGGAELRLPVLVVSAGRDGLRVRLGAGAMRSAGFHL